MSGGQAAPQPQTFVLQSPAPAFVVEVGPKEIYDKLLELGTQVKVMNEGIKDLIEQGKDHEDRLRALERNRWPMHLLTAIIALAAFLASVFDIKIGS